MYSTAVKYQGKARIKADWIHSVVLGEVNGRLQPVFSKLASLHAKNGFSFAIAVGNLFAEDNEAISELLEGKITVPLPTYFTVGQSPLPARIVEKIEKDEEVTLAPIPSPLYMC
jgi:hypothetical protein